MKVIDDRLAYGNFEWKISKLYGIVCAIYQLRLIVLMGMCSEVGIESWRSMRSFYWNLYFKIIFGAIYK
jgi:hypothetical protein